MIVLPKLPNKVPTNPTKPLFWTKLPNMKVKDTIWIKGGVVDNLDKLNIDYKALEETFSIKKKPVAINGPKAKPKEKPKVITLVDGRRAQQIGIVIGYLKIDPLDLQKMIIKLDDSKLNDDDIQKLIPCMPTSEEVKKQLEYKGDESLLSPADKFLRAVSYVEKINIKIDDGYSATCIKT